MVHIIFQCNIQRAFISNNNDHLCNMRVTCVPRYSDVLTDLTATHWWEDNHLLCTKYLTKNG